MKNNAKGPGHLRLNLALTETDFDFIDFKSQQAGKSDTKRHINALLWRFYEKYKDVVIQSPVQYNKTRKEKRFHIPPEMLDFFDRLAENLNISTSLFILKFVLMPMFHEEGCGMMEFISSGCKSASGAPVFEKTGYNYTVTAKKKSPAVKPNEQQCIAILHKYANISNSFEVIVPHIKKEMGAEFTDDMKVYMRKLHKKNFPSKNLPYNLH